MRKFIILILFLAFTITCTNIVQAANADYDSQVEALYSKRAQLDAELSKSSPNPSKIESLSKEIGELQGKVLSSDVRNSRQGNGEYYRGYGHHHGGGHRCW